MTPNDHYSGLTAPLTSKRCILYIYSTNIGTEYFNHGIYSQLFSSSKCSLFHNSNVFGSYIIHILYTGCVKIKKIIPAPKCYPSKYIEIHRHCTYWRNSHLTRDVLQQEDRINFNFLHSFVRKYVHALINDLGKRVSVEVRNFNISKGG